MFLCLTAVSRVVIESYEDVISLLLSSEPLQMEKQLLLSVWPAQFKLQLCKHTKRDKTMPIYPNIKLTIYQLKLLLSLDLERMSDSLWRVPEAAVITASRYGLMGEKFKPPN